MAWNPEQQELTLLVENHGSTQRPRYKLTGWMQRTTPEGDTILTPIPNFDGLRALTFTAIAIHPPHSQDLSASAGQLALMGRSR